MSNPVFNLKNTAPDTLEIDIEGTIGGGWFEDGATKEDVKKQLKDIAQSRASHIIVNINSYGGDVNHGISIHDLLAEHKAKVTTVIHGHTASAATIISQAGDIRKMSDNALFLVHRASTFAIGNSSDIKTALSDLEKCDETIANIYAKRTGKTIEEALEIMDRFDGRGEWLTASEAKELGFVDEVFEPMKAVASVDQNDLIKLGLPILPENKINMKSDKQTVFAWFKEFTNKITGKEEPARPDPDVTPDPNVEHDPEKEQTIDKDNPEGVTVADQPKNEIVIRDMEEVQGVLTDLTDQIAERDTQITELSNKITALENDVARLGGKPTKTEPREDPTLDKSNLPTNELNAAKNAAALRGE
jgi:ATP-dependent protease ClpP protease subunit